MSKIFYGNHLSTCLFVLGLISYEMFQFLSRENTPQKSNAWNCVEYLEGIYSETVLNWAGRVLPSAFTFSPTQAGQGSLGNWKPWVTLPHLRPLRTCCARASRSLLLHRALRVDTLLSASVQEAACYRKDCFSETVLLISKELRRREGFLCRPPLLSLRPLGRVRCARRFQLLLGWDFEPSKGLWGE